MSTKVRGTKLFGAMVIALREGQRLGWVSEVYIDKGAKRIQGITYRSGTFGKDGEIFVGFGDILKFSRDFVIVSGQAEGREVPAEVASRGLRALRGCKITTHAGKYIETLADLIIDREDGSILEILLTENRVLRIDMADVQFGPDLVMVPADYQPVVSPAESEPTGFTDRLFRSGSLSHSVREGYEGIKSAVRTRINPETVKKTWENGSQTAKRTMLRTSQAIQQGIDQIMKKRAAEKGAEKPDSPESVTPMDETEAHTAPDRPDTIIDELAPESVAGAEPLDKPK
jgi:sporulation protein YlmC with PRC-barrel domain